MKTSCLITLLLAMLPALAHGEVEPVSIRIPKPTAWTGQRLPLFVEIHVRGSFDGTTSFSLPQVPRSVLIPVGNPVVSSKEIDGESWFVQTHEFALFSQQTGNVEIPPFEVRFAHRDGFTGPPIEEIGTVPAAKVEIQRPPGSEKLGFLVTTEAIDVNETWEPQPGATKAGAVFKRTISQQANEMTGMALAPPPQSVPDVIRYYLADPEVVDDFERGNFVGKRRDEITYVVQEPGTHTLPAISYVWWNPKSEQIQSKTLPAVTFEVAAPPVVAKSAVPPGRHSAWIWWFAAVGIVCAIGFWQRTRITEAISHVRHWLFPDERVAERALLHACRRNDADTASRAWLHWLDLQNSAFAPSAALAAAAIELQRHLYGPASSVAWRGHDLANAFTGQVRALDRPHRQHRLGELPPLNPELIDCERPH